MPRQRGRKGEGSIFFDQSKQRYVVKLPYPDPVTGRTRHLKRHFETEAQAVAFRRSDAARHAPSTGTVESFVRFWRSEIAPSSRNLKTLRNNDSWIDGYILPAFGKTRLDRLTPEQIQRWVNAIEHRTTAIYVYDLLRLILDRAVRMRRLAHNPFDGTEKPARAAFQPRILTADECRRLRSAAADTALEGPVRAVLTLGLRKGEVLGAKWAHLDVLAGRWRVLEQWRDEERASRAPKGQKTRTLAIPEGFRLWLCSQRDVAASIFVFPGPDGGPMRGRYLTSLFHAALARAGLPRMRFHDLRSTWMSHLNEIGTDPAAIAQLAGHARPNVTFDRYVRSFEQTQVAALRALEESLG